MTTTTEARLHEECEAHARTFRHAMLALPDLTVEDFLRKFDEDAAAFGAGHACPDFVADWFLRDRFFLMSLLVETQVEPREQGAARPSWKRREAIERAVRALPGPSEFDEDGSPAYPLDGMVSSLNLWAEFANAKGSWICRTQNERRHLQKFVNKLAGRFLWACIDRAG